MLTQCSRSLASLAVRSSCATAKSFHPSILSAAAVVPRHQSLALLSQSHLTRSHPVRCIQNSTSYKNKFDDDLDDFSDDEFFDDGPTPQQLQQQLQQQQHQSRPQQSQQYQQRAPSSYGQQNNHASSRPAYNSMQQSSASFGGGGRPQLNNEELAELSPGSEVNQSYVAPQLADANPTNPKLLVSNFQMQPHLAQAIASRFKITQFYPIQAECFQPIVDKKDILGRSQTGTGKTLAFVLPLIERLFREPLRIQPGTARIVIIEPTRELANQVMAEIIKLSPQTRCISVYGGVPYNAQIQALMAGVDIMIGTPGRMLDHLQKGAVSLENCMSVVLDEADELLRMGFAKSVQDIISYAPRKDQRQTLLFSATVPAWVQQVAQTQQNRPITIDKVSGSENQTPTTITHKAIQCPLGLVHQMGELARLVKTCQGRVIVFVNKKSDAEIISMQLQQRYHITSRQLHGDIAQNRRDQIMQQFREGKFRMLVATDVAARGIDVPNVEMVVQVGLPMQLEFFLHRAGRTGRGGRKGTAVALFSPAEMNNLRALGSESGIEFQLDPATNNQGFKNSLLTGSNQHLTLHITAQGSPIYEQSAMQALETVLGRQAQVGQMQPLNKTADAEAGFLVDVSREDANQILQKVSTSSPAGISIKSAAGVSTKQFPKIHGLRYSNMMGGRGQGGQGGPGANRRQPSRPQQLNQGGYQGGGGGGGYQGGNRNSGGYGSRNSGFDY